MRIGSLTESDRGCWVGPYSIGLFQTFCHWGGGLPGVHMGKEASFSFKDDKVLGRGGGGGVAVSVLWDITVWG